MLRPLPIAILAPLVVSDPVPQLMPLRGRLD